MVIFQTSREGSALFSDVVPVPRAVEFKMATGCKLEEVISIDILGPRLPTHTWRGRHMYEDSRWRRQPGKNIIKSITNYRFLGFFGDLTAPNPVPLDFFENRPLLRRFWM